MRMLNELAVIWVSEMKQLSYFSRTVFLSRSKTLGKIFYGGQLPREALYISSVKSDFLNF
jgi:hypothetical protein